jgi:alcohol dehydrogenase (cytochrome c)/quinohemoprotein ethanol dehydrogenase
VCHAPAAVGSTVLPDLRRSATIASKDAFSAVVYDGILKDRGMVSFKGSLTKEEIDAVREYIIKRANEDKVLEGSGKVAQR